MSDSVYTSTKEKRWIIPWRSIDEKFFYSIRWSLRVLCAKTHFKSHSEEIECGWLWWYRKDSTMMLARLWIVFLIWLSRYVFVIILYFYKSWFWKMVFGIFWKMKIEKCSAHTRGIENENWKMVRIYKGDIPLSPAPSRSHPRPCVCARVHVRGKRTRAGILISFESVCFNFFVCNVYFFLRGFISLQESVSNGKASIQLERSSGAGTKYMQQEKKAGSSFEK